MRRPSASPRRALVAALLFSATLLPAAATPAAAALPGHTGTRGIHVLIDSMEYPGITCHYNTFAPGRLKRIALRRPVIYAPDTTAGRDQRWVGWRFRIQRSPDATTWTNVYTSPVVKALAYDDQPAVLDPRGKDLVGVYGYTYRGVVDLTWYTPSGSSTVTGKATHPTTTHLSVFGDMEGADFDGCAGSLDPAAAAALSAAARPHTAGPAGPPPTHVGEYGLHTLIDSFTEFPGAICRIKANDDLKVSVRAPAVWATDGFSGAQQVRWRYTIKGYNLESASPAVIPPYSFTSPWATGSATEDRAARWAPLRTKTVTDPAFPYYIVTVRIEWLGTGSPNPYVIHQPYHKNGAATTGYCVAAPL